VASSKRRRPILAVTGLRDVQRFRLSLLRRDQAHCAVDANRPTLRQCWSGPAVRLAGVVIQSPDLLARE
jgi:hypothetical protein